jgi:hypothetical protein
MDAGTMISRTPDRKRAATVRRRRREGTMRIGGWNKGSIDFKDVDSDVWEDGFEAIL